MHPEERGIVVCVQAVPYTMRPLPQNSILGLILFKEVLLYIIMYEILYEIGDGMLLCESVSGEEQPITSFHSSLPLRRPHECVEGVKIYA